MSWLDRLRGGLTKTAARVGENLTGITKQAALDTATLDDIEEALIASDLGPEASRRIREAIAQQRFEQLDERGLRTILAEEIEAILAPVAKPLDGWGFRALTIRRLPHALRFVARSATRSTTAFTRWAYVACCLWRQR